MRHGFFPAAPIATYDNTNKYTVAAAINAELVSHQNSVLTSKRWRFSLNKQVLIYTKIYAIQMLSTPQKAFVTPYTV